MLEFSKVVTTNTTANVNIKTTSANAILDYSLLYFPTMQAVCTVLYCTTLYSRFYADLYYTIR